MPKKKAAASKTTTRERRTEGRVMHEFKHGELKSGPAGKGGKVKSRKQAIAIALSEAGASNRKTKTENRKTRATTAKNETKGRTAQQQKEGQAKVGARGKKESTKAMGGKSGSPTRTKASHAGM
jgi:hypothetical protein